MEVKFVSDSTSNKQNYFMWFFTFVHDSTLVGKFEKNLELESVLSTLKDIVGFEYNEELDIDGLWKIWEICECYIKENSELQNAELDFSGNVLNTFNTKPIDIQGNVMNAITTLSGIVSIAETAKMNMTKEQKTDKFNYRQKQLWPVNLKVENNYFHTLVKKERKSKEGNKQNFYCLEKFSFTFNT